MLCQPEIIVNDDLPALSWLVDVSTHAKIFVGSQVEVVQAPSKISVFEGAWEGPFDALGFQESANFFGSGIVIDKEHMTFITPTHTLESLYVLYDESKHHHEQRKTYISNSLSFIVTYSGAHLRADQKTFKKLQSVIKGIHDFDSVLYDCDGIKILRFICCNFRLCGKESKITKKNEPPHFIDYKSYQTYLVNVLSQLCDNATSLKRKIQYRLTTTVSHGYDSTACAALASLVGGHLALTIKTSRSGLIDSGKGVAEALGLDCVEALRKNPGDSENFAEAAFIVGGSGGDCVFHAFKERLAGTLLLTGFHGDKIWDLHTEPTSYMKRGDASGNGLHEFRLHQGFLNAPVPFIGAVRHSELHQIAHSSDMKPYVVGTTYDRPIPRRIAEEAGVPRDSFGVQKQAAGFTLVRGEASLSTVSRADIEAFATRRGGHISAAERLHVAFRDLLSAVWRLSNRGMLATSGAHKIARIPFKGFRLLSIYLTKMYERAWPFDDSDDLLLLWALDKIGARYSVVRNGKETS